MDCKKDLSRNHIIPFSLLRATAKEYECSSRLERLDVHAVAPTLQTSPSQLGLLIPRFSFYYSHARAHTRARQSQIASREFSTRPMQEDRLERAAHRMHVTQSSSLDTIVTSDHYFDSTAAA